MRWLLKAAGFPLALVPSVALPLFLVGAAEQPGKAVEDAYRALPELPAAAPADSVGDLEQAAVELAARLNAVPLDPSGERLCPSDRLRVSWATPADDYQWGAHLDPVGPAPTADTDAANGVVLCEGSRYGFMGFEAWRTDGDWSLAAVPYVHEEAEEHAHAPAPVAPAVPAPAKPAPPAPALPAPLSLDLPTGTIEGYAAYEPQRLCDPAPKPGTLALRNLLLGNNPGTRNLGISRACGAGGQSEHKEGRALDWGVLVSRASEEAAAERFIGGLMATDDQGNRHALARRMGVMYVIWNRQIWSSYRPSAGWRPYGGASPHTDHVHISLSWAGAQGRTSFWSGKVDPSTLLAYQPPAPSGGSGLPAAQPVSHHRRAVQPEVGTLPTEAVREADEDREDLRREKGERDRDERRRGRGKGRWDRDDDVLAVRTAEQAKHDADEAARKAAEEAQRQAEEEARQAAEEAKRQEHAARQAHEPNRRGHGGHRHEPRPEQAQERDEVRDGAHGRKAKGEAKSKDKGHGKGKGKGHGHGKGKGKG